MISSSSWPQKVTATLAGRSATHNGRVLETSSPHWKRVEFPTERYGLEWSYYHWTPGPSELDIAALNHLSLSLSHTHTHTHLQADPV